MRRRNVVSGGAVLGSVGLVVVSISGGPAAGGVGEHGVGVVTETFVDGSRDTPRSGEVPEVPGRTLVTTTWYPADVAPGGAPVADAPPDASGAPYPVILFSHGFSATPALYEELLSSLAAAGFLVIAPQFPLSSGGRAGPPDAADVVNQPGDISFLIDQILDAPDDDSEPFGIVDPDAIGVAGHSNGGITTLGLIAHTCCRDDRIEAAAVLAGTPAPFPDGEYELGETPPVLVVHGDEDVQVSYEDTVRAFNKMRGPKVHLTIEGGDHGSSALLSTPESDASTLQTTVDFFDRYLRDDKATIARLPDDAVPGVTEVFVATKPGSTKKIPIAPPVHYDRKASVTPDKGLEGGQMVTVEWEGFSPGGVINIVQCGDEKAATAGCDLTKAIILHDDPTGEGSLVLEVVEGPVGTEICDAEHPPCSIVFNDDSSQDPDAIVRVPIRFAR